MASLICPCAPPCVQHLIQSGGERGLGHLLPRQVDADPETLGFVGVQELVVIHGSQYLTTRENRKGLKCDILLLHRVPLTVTTVTVTQLGS